MSISSITISVNSISNFYNKIRNYRKNQSGATAIEFAMVIGPFLMLVYGIMKLGIIFFTIFALDNAVEQASRLVRTGQAGAIDKAAFKTQVCARAPVFVNCGNDIRVDVQSDPDLSSINPPSGTGGGGAYSDDGDFTYTTGSGGDYVLVTVFYKWTSVPFKSVLDIGNMADGSYLIRSSAAFRNEPFTQAAP